jgi:hypothetical protein
MKEGVVLAAFFIVALAGISALMYPAMSGMMIRGSAIQQYMPAPIRAPQVTQISTTVPDNLCTEKYKNHPLCKHCFDSTTANDDQMCVHAWNDTAQPVVYKRTGIRSFYIDETGIILGNNTDGGIGKNGMPEI